MGPTIATNSPFFTVKVIFFNKIKSAKTGPSSPSFGLFSSKLF